MENNIEYISNWIEQYGLLCTPQYEVGLLGSCYFIGVIISIIPVPYYSDIIGRRSIFLASMIFSMSAEAILIYSKNIECAFFLMIFLGMCFSGKNVVGLNLLNEH